MIRLCINIIISDFISLKEECTVYKRSAFAKSTLANMLSHVKNYFGFCIFFNRDTLPPSPNNLCLFATFLSRSFNSPQSIQNNISSLKSLCTILELPVLQFESIQLKLTLRGIKRSKQHVKKQASPITPSILFNLHQVIDHADPSQVTYWCAFLISFFAMARKSNIMFTASSTAVNRPILRKDCKVTSGGLLLHFRWSKTNSDSSRVHKVPLVPILGSPFCPVLAFKRMKKLVPASRDSPAFVMPFKNNLTPMVYHKYQLFLRKKLSDIGLPSMDFSSHSFRRGGATWAFKCAVPGELIQQHGDWASAAYLAYLDFSLEQKALVSMKLAEAIKVCSLTHC